MPSFEYIATKTNQEKKKVEHATIEEIICDLTNAEDPDMQLMIAGQLDGTILIQSFDSDEYGSGKTMREALFDFGKTVFDVDIDPDYTTLDWRGVTNVGNG